MRWTYAQNDGHWSHNYLSSTSVLYIKISAVWIIYCFLCSINQCVNTFFIACGLISIIALLIKLLPNVYTITVQYMTYIYRNVDECPFYLIEFRRCNHILKRHFRKLYLVTAVSQIHIRFIHVMRGNYCKCIYCNLDFD